ncbi:MULTISPECIES: phenylalanine--tRNA ligase subunit alpha [Dethiosulfovibrio]|jgi:phenylalanyl-tRNA synthetase alpha chain|uniref:Phenylalanine--tRNA ligase alpha subunit n=2 Tax=Dethiosulfovibrio TaxID=47054 RepID=A0ABS9EQ61_9BACT|nr:MULTISPECIES: phenylalanine--tRNA ligase subunit alpha [Dethiosulfovibrio]MCF4115016.1 phenylalanine--tRNA ligase subunit alpha [Dethiosulfovibrio russensis]MCF4143339.1 phenylalanine--tRNA ligase subunit alpha [Dethiosulfovibrio marinus]MCF4145542.1 phenylalanine--tRNA ligase subunit alpha [Dethiosulfovibrio acidaminovorans]
MDLKLDIEGVRSSFLSELEDAKSLDDLKDLRVRYLGKKGKVTALLKSLGTMSPEERPEAGKVINELKQVLDSDLAGRSKRAEDEALRKKELEEFVDVTQPARGRLSGGVHPVMQVMYDVSEILTGLGFSVALGPEVEDDFHNFEALNIPPHHPARDMQDTFYFDDGRLLRTHTSPVQVRSMLAYGAPLRVACPGKVYRRDSDPTHSPMFHQIEGLLVEEDVSIGDLKGCLEAMVSAIFSRPLKARYRASYFPFTEPSMEVDIECIACSGKDPSCRICKGTGWLEIGGMGMVHPEVLRAGGVDPERFNGFAWGMGLDRIAMLKYDLRDLRPLFEGDLSYLLSGRDE